MPYTVLLCLKQNRGGQCAVRLSAAARNLTWHSQTCARCQERSRPGSSVQTLHFAVFCWLLAGALVWSPFLCAVALAVMQPTKAEIEQQQEEAVKQVGPAAAGQSQNQQQQQQRVSHRTTLQQHTLLLSRCCPFCLQPACVAHSCTLNVHQGNLVQCFCRLFPCQAVAAAEVQAYRHLPVTPVESVAWLNRLNQEMWQPFWQPFLLANNLSSWQVRGSCGR